MAILINVLQVVHVINAILMAWPYYALVAVNQRALLGPPLGDRIDVYMEAVVKNRVVPCFAFQATALVTGLGLILARGMRLNVLISNPVLGLKFVLLLLIGGLLSYVHLRVQPQIDALFAQAGTPVAPELGARIGALRVRRKRLAATCLFVVLTIAMLGVQAWAPFPLWLTLALAVGLAGFTWRAYGSVTPYGWL
jgi:hypothetical protein